MDVYSDISDEDSNSSAVEEVNPHRCILAEEAFTYLLDRFGIRRKTQSRFRYFSDEAGQAVVTIAYAYRKRLRTLFRSVSVNFADVNEFKKFSEQNFELIQDECYFYRVLKRISHLFELVVYCLSEGHDYIGTAREVDLFGNSAQYFFDAGGLRRLNQTAAFIADVGKVLYSAMEDESPQDVILGSFVEVVQALENPEGGEMPPMKRGLLSVIKKRISSEMPDVNDLDVRVARVFYHIICQHTSKVITVSRRSRVDDVYWREEEYVGIDREKEAIIESLRIAVRIIFGQTDFFNLDPPIKLAECFAALRHLTDLISPVLEDPQQAIPEHVVPDQLTEDERRCYSLKEYFVVSSDYVAEREGQLADPPAVQNEVSTLEQPSRKKLYKKSLMKVMDANIRQGNCFRLNDGRCVVHTPDCKFDHTTTTIFYDG